MATAAKTVYSHVTKDPEVCGGKACIDGTRIRVMDIEALAKEEEPFAHPVRHLKVR